MKKSVVVLLHIGYWLVYLMLLLIIYGFIGMSNPRAGNFHIFWRYLLFGFTVLPGIFAFYATYFLLFTRFLQRKRIVLLILFGLLAAGFGAVCGGIFLSFVFGKIFLFADGWYSATAEWLAMTAVAVIHGALALVMRGFISWYGDIKIKEELNRKNYETELALVKAQISPHFLFNTINNIDVLIGIDPDKASAYLNKLSDIMRFMLYETKTEEILLSKELAYIEKYIELQKIRASNPDYVHYVVEGNPGHQTIAPMLLISCIENAFKHGELKKKENAIRIHINITAHTLTFTCENKFVPHADSSNDASGLGNALMKKRLHLLYPNAHKLDIQIKEETYSVKLTLNHHAH